MAILREVGRGKATGVEIGVYKGALSWLLLANMPQLFLYMVDSWAEAPSDSSYLTTDDKIARFSQAEHDEVRKTATAAVQQFGDRCRIIAKPSVEAAAEFEDGSLDFVFIDGDHSYAGCKADIEAWAPKVRTGGIVGGHDYREDKAGFGVIKAVGEFYEPTMVRRGYNHTWFTTKT
jgi:predicted O-methyltransferase YrrM